MLKITSLAKFTNTLSPACPSYLSGARGSVIKSSVNVISNRARQQCSEVARSSKTKTNTAHRSLWAATGVPGLSNPRKQTEISKASKVLPRPNLVEGLRSKGVPACPSINRAQNLSSHITQFSRLPPEFLKTLMEKDSVAKQKLSKAPHKSREGTPHEKNSSLESHGDSEGYPFLLLERNSIRNSLDAILEEDYISRAPARSSALGNFIRKSVHEMWTKAKANQAKSMREASSSKSNLKSEETESHANLTRKLSKHVQFSTINTVHDSNGQTYYSQEKDDDDDAPKENEIRKSISGWRPSEFIYDNVKKKESKPAGHTELIINSQKGANLEDQTKSKDSHKNTKNMNVKAHKSLDAKALLESIEKSCSQFRYDPATEGLKDRLLDIEVKAIFGLSKIPENSTSDPSTSDKSKKNAKMPVAQALDVKKPLKSATPFQDDVTAYLKEISKSLSSSAKPLSRTVCTGPDQTTPGKNENEAKAQAQDVQKKKPPVSTAEAPEPELKKPTDDSCPNTQAELEGKRRKASDLKEMQKFIAKTVTPEQMKQIKSDLRKRFENELEPVLTNFIDDCTKQVTERIIKSARNNSLMGLRNVARAQATNKEGTQKTAVNQKVDSPIGRGPIAESLQKKVYDHYYQTLSKSESRTSKLINAESKSGRDTLSEHPMPIRVAVNQPVRSALKKSPSPDAQTKDVILVGDGSSSKNAHVSNPNLSHFKENIRLLQMEMDLMQEHKKVVAELCNKIGKHPSSNLAVPMLKPPNTTRSPNNRLPKVSVKPTEIVLNMPDKEMSRSQGYPRGQAAACSWTKQDDR